MVKTVDHTERKNRVLAAAVSAYINAGVPVSSHELADYFELCPATLRNILAELEDDGYLFMGHSETLNGMDLPLSLVSPTTYRKKP